MQVGKNKQISKLVFFLPHIKGKTVLQHGEIVEEGNYGELMQAKGVFFEMVLAQQLEIAHRRESESDDVDFIAPMRLWHIEFALTQMWQNYLKSSF